PLMGECRPGKNVCLGAAGWDPSCAGSVGPRPEICDGKDNNCDGLIDDGATCPAESKCVNGECVPFCRADEVSACPPDRTCKDDLCIRKACATKACPAAQYCDADG